MIFQRKGKLILGLIKKNLFLNLLLFIMIIISLYMVDITLSDYIYNTRRIDLFLEGCNYEPDCTYVIKRLNSNTYETEKNANYQNFTELLKQINNIEHLGIYNSNYYFLDNNDIGFKVLIAQRDFLQLCNLGIKESLYDELNKYNEDICPVLVGCDIADDFPVGSTFSYVNKGKDDCVVVGVLPKKARWLAENSPLSEQDMKLNDSLVLCPYNFENMFQMSGDATEPRDIYLNVNNENKEQVMKDIYQASIQSGYTFSIKSYDDIVESFKDSGVAFDVKQLVASILLMIIAIISISVSMIAICLLNSKFWGIMYVSGYTDTDVFSVVWILTFFPSLFGGIIAWFYRNYEIYKMYYSAVRGGINPLWISTHGVIIPLILAGIIILISIVSSIPAIMQLRKNPPASMIKSI